MLFHILFIKCEYIAFYDDEIVTKRGVFKKKVKTSPFLGVLSVSVDQTFWGRFFKYGNVVVDTFGRWDVALVKIAKPEKLKRYLETKPASRAAAAFDLNPIIPYHNL